MFNDGVTMPTPSPQRTGTRRGAPATWSWSRRPPLGPGFMLHPPAAREVEIEDAREDEISKEPKANYLDWPILGFAGGSGHAAVT